MTYAVRDSRWYAYSVRDRLFQGLVSFVVAVVTIGCAPGPSADQAKALKSLESVAPVAVEQDERGNVIALKISSPALTDEKGTAIKELTTLERLNLKQTGISDETLRSIGTLANLRTLYLDDVSITGAGMAHLAGCQNLEELTLAGCPIDDEAAPVIGGFASLRLLDLSRTKLTDRGLADLGSLSKLEVIYLSRASVTGSGFAELKDLPRLQLIDLSGIPIDEKIIDTIAHYPDLDRLYLGESSLSDELLPKLIATLVASNPKLRGLAIPDVPLTNDSIATLKRLQELPELALVDMRNTKITKDAFRELTQAVGEVNFTADYPVED